jgi:hypothetical protein
MAGILQQFGGAAQQAMAQPYQQFNGPRVANLSPLQQQSMAGYGNLLSDNSWDQAQGTYSDLQSGSMNPYNQQVRDTTAADVTRAYDQATMSTLRRSNSPGNLGSARADMAQGQNDQNLARGLAQGMGSINANAFDNMQNRRLQAAQGSGNLANLYSGILGNAANAGNMQRGFDQQVIDANYGDWQTANNYSWDQLGRGANIFGQLQGAAPRTTTTTGPGSDPVSQGLGLWMLGSNMGRSGK